MPGRARTNCSRSEGCRDRAWQLRAGHAGERIDRGETTATEQQIVDDIERLQIVGGHDVLRLAIPTTCRPPPSSPGRFTDTVFAWLLGTWISDRCPGTEARTAPRPVGGETSVGDSGSGVPANTSPAPGGTRNRRGSRPAAPVRSSRAGLSSSRPAPRSRLPRTSPCRRRTRRPTVHSRSPGKFEESRKLGQGRPARRWWRFAACRCRRRNRRR